MIKRNDWESDFFGYEVATATSYTGSSLIKDIDQARSQGVKLLIFRFDSSLEEQLEELKKIANLVDRKITFVAQTQKDKDANPNILNYSGKPANEKLIELAQISGERSRFKIDPNFANNEFERMYEAWIKNSLSKEIADFVLVYEDEGSPQGLLTFKCSGDEANIGLVAVDPASQGLGIGGALLNACHARCRDENVEKIFVPTQKENQKACHFYLKNGFTVFKEELIFHYWTTS